LTWCTRPVCCGRVDHRNAALDHFVAAFLLDKASRLYEQKARSARCRASPKRAVRGGGGPPGKLCRYRERKGGDRLGGRRIIGDIGGTNARFAIAQGGKYRELMHVEVVRFGSLQSADFSDGHLRLAVFDLAKSLIMWSPISGMVRQHRHRFLKREQGVRHRPGALGLLPVEPARRERNEKSPVRARGKG
jgi:hypothetical protein